MRHVTIKSWRRFRRMPHVPTFITLYVPVVDGRATLPDGRTIETEAKWLAVPRLVWGIVPVR